MSSSKSDRNSEKKIVSVTKHGQATIPKQFREKLGIDTPGKVLFREAEDGTIVVEQIRSPSEMRGFAKEHGESTTDKPATQLLREKREREKQERENHPSLEE